jgi:hypothetical protein
MHLLKLTKRPIGRIFGFPSGEFSEVGKWVIETSALDNSQQAS